ncbi:MAG: hypothetical protein ACK2U9_05520 [Anaerolineae bacterium]
MGDAPGIGCLSVLPLLIILVSIVVAVIAWRSGKRPVRTGAAIVLMVGGIGSVLFGGSLLLSIAGGGLIFVVGLVLLIAEYRLGRLA